MSTDIDGYCDVWSEKIVVARKDRKCGACNELILKGHRYLSHFSVFRSNILSVARCLRCDAIYDHLKGRMKSNEQPDHNLDCEHGYRDRWGEEPPVEIAALAFVTQVEMQATFNQQKGLGNRTS